MKVWVAHFGTNLATAVDLQFVHVGLVSVVDIRCFGLVWVSAAIKALHGLLLFGLVND